jgi:hypothetical protein
MRFYYLALLLRQVVARWRRRGRVKVELDREHGTLARDFVFTHNLIVHIFV